MHRGRSGGRSSGSTMTTTSAAPRGSPGARGAPSGTDRSVMRIDLNGVGLEVRVEGPEDGAPVVLLHGWPDRASLWDAQIVALNGAGFRTIAPDLRGFGDSDKPVGVEHYNILTLAGDVLGILDHLG